jgi:hypothetical protein
MKHIVPLSSQAVAILRALQPSERRRIMQAWSDFLAH